MQPTIGFSELLIIGLVCCVPLGISAALGAVLIRMRKKRNP